MRLEKRFQNNLKGADMQELEGLSFNRLLSLVIIRQRGPLSLSELADILKISTPSASALVEKLYRLRLVKRVRASKDRRKIEIEIPAHALKGVFAVERAMTRTLSEIVDTVGEENFWLYHDRLFKAS